MIAHSPIETQRQVETERVGQIGELVVDRLVIELAHVRQPEGRTAVKIRRENKLFLASGKSRETGQRENTGKQYFYFPVHLVPPLFLLGVIRKLYYARILLKTVCRTLLIAIEELSFKSCLVMTIIIIIIIAPTAIAAPAISPGIRVPPICVGKLSRMPCLGSLLKKRPTASISSFVSISLNPAFDSISHLKDRLLNFHHTSNCDQIVANKIPS
ncbi:MAG: hypothetical protein GX444_07965 [Myxococcales bacterium]|nr:hypothetical protein [Myxococcales bacterium]